MYRTENVTWIIKIPTCIARVSINLRLKITYTCSNISYINSRVLLLLLDIIEKKNFSDIFYLIVVNIGLLIAENY